MLVDAAAQVMPGPLGKSIDHAGDGKSLWARIGYQAIGNIAGHTLAAKSLLPHGYEFRQGR